MDQAPEQVAGSHFPGSSLPVVRSWAGSDHDEAIRDHDKAMRDHDEKL
ncbi:hypothetical protein LSAT2_027657, partial [Lamellibrachia satsuma]